MRIVYLNPIAQSGGAERSLIDIWAALRALAPDLELHLICAEDGPLRLEAERYNVVFHVLPMPPGLAYLGDAGAALAGNPAQTIWLMARLIALGGATLAYAVRLRRLLSKLRPTILHSNGLRYHLLTGLARPTDVPSIWHIRDFITPRPLVRRLLRVARRGVSVMMANSEATASDAHIALPDVPVVTVYNGIDLDTFTPGPGQPQLLDELAGLPPAPLGTIRVGLISTYARWKGQDLLLRVASRIARESPDVPLRFYIVGGPIYQTQGSQFSLDELRDLAVAAGCPAVGFIPFQNRPESVYRALDVVVHASTRPEPFGRTIAEAMACGRAVVASLAGGVGEVIRPGTDALAFQPNDESGLIAAILELARNPAVRCRLGKNGRVNVSRFSRRLMGERILHIYQCLSDKKSFSSVEGNDPL